MKKITLLILTLFMSLVGYSQVFFEGFESNNLPDYDADVWNLETPGLASGVWQVFDNGVGTNVNWTSTPLPYEGDKAAYMNRGNEPGLLVQDYLATPLVTIPQNGQLRFFARTTAIGNQQTFYKIMVAPFDAIPNDPTFYTPIFQYTEQTLSATFNVYQENTVDLSAYAGQQIYIAFVMEFTQPGAAATGDRWLLDNVRVVEQCFAPTGLDANQIGQNQATLSWVSNSTAFEIEVVGELANFTGTGVPATTPYLASGLTPNTCYKYRVRTICGGGVPSEWSESFPFCTAVPGFTCNSAIAVTPLPFITTDNTSNYGDTYDITQPSSCVAGPNYMSGNDVYYYFTPTITGAVLISLNSTSNGSSLFVYDNCAALGVQCIAGVANNSNGIRTIESLPVIAGNDYLIVVSSNANQSQTVPYTLTIQTIACAAPVSVAATSTGIDDTTDPDTYTVNLSWQNAPGATSTSFEIFVQAQGGVMPTGPGETVTVTPDANGVFTYEVTGLTGGPAFALGTYQFWVRAACENPGEFSPWVGPRIFNTTTCDVGCSYNFVLVDDFGDGWNGSLMNVVQNGIVVQTLGTGFTTGFGPITVSVPLCDGPFELIWTNQGSFPDEVGVSIVSSLGQTLFVKEVRTGGQVITNPLTPLFSGLVNCTVLQCLPPTALTATAPTTNGATISWTPDPTFVPTSWEIYAVASTGNPPVNGPAPTPTTPATVTIPGSTVLPYILSSPLLLPDTTYTYYVRPICTVGANSWSAVSQPFTTLPTCPRPTALNLVSVGLNSAVINWTNGTATDSNWEVLVLPANSPAPTSTSTGFVSAQTGSPFTIENLVPSTCYDVYIRTVCTPTDSSTWSGPLAVCTTQIPAVLPLVEGFEGANEWTLVNGNEVNKWIIGTATNNGGTKALYVTDDNGVSNSYTNSITTVTHAYRDIAIPAGANEINLSFDWRNDGEGQFTEYDWVRAWLVPTTYTPIPGTIIDATNGRTAISVQLNEQPTYINASYDLPTTAIAGTTVRLVFEWRNDGSGGQDPPGAVDNVNISVITCPKPIALITSEYNIDSIALDWTPVGTETAWEYITVAANSPVPAANDPRWTATNEHPVTITDLDPATPYDFYVRAICTPETDISLISGPVRGNTTICDATTQCNYTFTVSDSFSDGWNGALMQVRQNGIVIETLTLPTGQGPVSFTVPVCAGVPVDLFWITPGSFPNEVRVSVSNSFNQNVFAITTNSGNLAGTVLWSSAAPSCTVPECQTPTALSADPNTTFATLSWDFIPGVTYQIYVVPVGSPAPNAGTTPTYTTSTHPFVTDSNLNALSSYVFYVRMVCPSGVGTSSWSPGTTFITLPTCPEPRDIFSETTETEGVIYWTEVGPATSWEVFVVPAGSPVPLPGSGSIVTMNPAVNPISYNTLTGPGGDVLFPGLYEFYVRSLCSPDDTSVLAGPHQFFILSVLPICADVEPSNPELTADGTIELCPGETCVDITATFTENRATTSYEIEPIPFSPPFPFAGGIELDIETDDIWGPAFTLPFNFCFFGTNYTSLQVGSNGVLTFTPQTTFCPWNTDPNITVPNPAFPIRNAIYGVYQDIDPSVDTPILKTINYQVLGTAPCRIFVVNYVNIAQFSCQLNQELQTSQIVLYETSNLIEIYIKDRVPCTSWNEGSGVVGIQNTAGTLGYTPPGRNLGTWTARNEAWRFKPAGASNVTFSWLQDGEFYSNDTTINICVDQTTRMTAQAIYAGCGGVITTKTSDVLLNVNVVDVLPVDDVNVCEPYTLPALAVGNYFTGPAGTGTQLNAGDIISETQTIYVYISVSYLDDVCSDEESFMVNIGAAGVVTPGDQIVCDSYTLPVLDAGNYFTEPAGAGTPLNAGDLITSTQTIYVYGVSDICTSDIPFLVTVNATPVIAPIDDVVLCEVPYILPVLAEGNYYTETLGAGTMLNAGDPITTDQTIYVYGINGTCFDEEVFTVSFGSSIVTTPGDQNVCGSYILPTLDFGNYFTEAAGAGTPLNAGDVITTTQTIYVYGVVGTCSDDEAFIVTVTAFPVIGTIDPVSSCDSYILPALAVGNYFTETNGGGTPLAAGDSITTTQEIFVYAANGTCTDEESFIVTIGTLEVTTPGDQDLCGSYILPALALGNYYTEANGAGTQLIAGQEITTTQTIYVYAASGSCVDDESFIVTITPIPVIATIANVDACGGYTLPALTVGNYFTETNGGGTPLAAGDVISTTQTVFVYAANGICTDEESFTVTISNLVVLDPIQAVSVCAPYPLPVLEAGLYYTLQGGTGEQLAAGTLISATQTVYVYLAGSTPACSAEQALSITVGTPPEFGFNNGCQGASYVIEVVPINESFDPSTATYSWSAADGGTIRNSASGQSIVVSGAVAYTVVVTSIDGCSTTQSFTPDSTGCNIQKGISANGDDINDNFELSELNVSKLQIFNRYGMVVYDKNNYTNEWKGQTNSGEELPDGTYYYVIALGSGEVKTGWIYINRAQN